MRSAMREGGVSCATAAFAAGCCRATSTAIRSRAGTVSTASGTAVVRLLPQLAALVLKHRPHLPQHDRPALRQPRAQFFLEHRPQKVRLPPGLVLRVRGPADLVVHLPALVLLSAHPLKHGLFFGFRPLPLR